jgi:hypothetical protein
MLQELSFAAETIGATKERGNSMRFFNFGSEPFERLKV